MTYSSGSLIQASDYNGFVNSANPVWNTAYGQSAIPTTSSTAIITATQWSTLNSSVAVMAAHQGTTITSRTNPTTGGIISTLSNLGTDIVSCNNNKYNAATIGSQYTTWSGNASLTSGAGSGSAAWTATFTDTVSFSSEAAASYFFNAGGYFKIQLSKTSTGTVADNEWNAFINNVCGTIFFTSTGASKTINGQTFTGTTKSGGTGTPNTLATGVGFAQLTSSPTTIYTQYDSGSAYSSNYVTVTAAFNGSTLTFVTTWHDSGDSNPGSIAQISGGTATTGISFGTAAATVVTYFAPETTYLSNTWGTPTVASTVV